MSDTGPVPGGYGAGRVRLAQVRDEPIGVEEVLEAVRDESAGGIGLFVGTVRRDDEGRAVRALDYASHPSAGDALRQVAQAIAARHDVLAVAVVHRTGHLAVGQVAVALAVSAVHRAAALEASRDLIDTLKTSVPIWKDQQFTDGTHEWSGMP